VVELKGFLYLLFPDQRIDLRVADFLADFPLQSHDIIKVILFTTADQKFLFLTGMPPQRDPVGGSMQDPLEQLIHFESSLPYISAPDLRGRTHPYRGLY
jgi:hypothetical protein